MELLVSVSILRSTIEKKREREREKEMVKSASVDSNGMKKGVWSEEEDNKLRAYVERYGHWNWTLLPKYADLSRCGKSCRLRWLNYLKPGLKRGSFTKEEEDLIIELHAQLGNQWSAIAARLPGRTDNDIKNFCNRRAVKILKHCKTTENREHLSEDQSHDPTSCETGQNESTSFDNVSPSFDTCPSELSMAQYDYYPPLPEEEEFFYPKFTYGELPSAYMSAHPSFYSDPFESNTSTSGSKDGYKDVPREEVGGVYDPLFEDFDHGMNLWE